MPPPDPARIARNSNVVFTHAGETATLRRFASASGGGAPLLGYGPQFNYTNFTITGLFYWGGFSQPRERQQAGGQTVDGRLFVATQFAIQQRDEITWRGTAMRVDGDVIPENLGGRFQFRAPLVLASKTG